MSLSQAFIQYELSFQLKAVPPLAKRLATVSDRNVGTVAILLANGSAIFIKKITLPLAERIAIASWCISERIYDVSTQVV